MKIFVFEGEESVGELERTHECVRMAGGALSKIAGWQVREEDDEVEEEDDVRVRCRVCAGICAFVCATGEG
jgi:hypothetical protein